MSPNFRFTDVEIQTWVRSCLTSAQICNVTEGIVKYQPSTIDDLFHLTEDDHLALTLSKLQLHLTKVFKFRLLEKKIVNNLSRGFKISASEIDSKLESFTEQQRTSSHLLCPTECNFCKKISYLSEVTEKPIDREMKHLMNYYKVHGDLTMLQRSLLLPSLVRIFQSPDLLLQPVVPQEPASVPEEQLDETNIKRGFSDSTEECVPEKRPRVCEQENEFDEDDAPDYCGFTSNVLEEEFFQVRSLSPNPILPEDSFSRSSTPDYSYMVLPPPKVKPCPRMAFDESDLPTGEATLF
jgi:hypothetical protein